MHRYLSTMLCLLPMPLLADPPKVVTDISPVHSLVARVMDGVGTPSLILPPGVSPHGYAMRPSEARALQEADQVFWVGPELTPWFARALENVNADAHQSELLDLEGLVRLDFREIAVFLSDGEHEHGHHEHGHDEHDHEEHAHDDHGHDDHDHEEHAHDDHGHDEHDHDEHAHDDHGHDAPDHEEHAHDDHGHDEHEHEEHAHDDHGHDAHDHEEHAHDDHGHDAHDHEEHAHDDHGHDAHDHHDHAHDGVDPHAWLDPINAQLWLTHIAEELAHIDPDNAATYRANAADARGELDQVIDTITAKLADAHDASFLVYHDAYQYFENRFDISAAGAIAASDATAPSAARMAELRDLVADTGLRCVFYEPQYSTRLVTALTQGSGFQQLELDPLGTRLELGPDLYPQLLTTLADQMASCL